MDMYFVNEFVKVMLMSCAKVNECLYGLVRVGRERLVLRSRDDFDCVISEDSKVGDRVVNVGRFVNSYEGFVEDCEEGAEKLKGCGLLRGHISKIILEYSMDEESQPLRSSSTSFPCPVAACVA